jgi:hypothetical protein
LCNLNYAKKNFFEKQSGSGGLKMKNISIADVTIHVDESLGKDTRAKLENDLRSHDGIISVHSSERTPHLIVVSFDADHATCKEILKVVLGEHLHAELIGL